MHKIAFILLVIGGINWGLTGLISGWDLGSFVGGTIAMIIYILVGLSAVVELFTHKKNCRHCTAGGNNMGGGM